MTINEEETYAFFVIDDDKLVEQFVKFLAESIIELQDRQSMQETRKELEELVSEDDLCKEIMSGNTNWNLIETYQRVKRLEFLIKQYKGCTDLLLKIYKQLLNTNIIMCCYIENSLALSYDCILPHRSHQLKIFIENFKQYKGLGTFDNETMIFVPDNDKNDHNNVKTIHLGNLKDLILE